MNILNEILHCTIEKVESLPNIERNDLPRSSHNFVQAIEKSARGIIAEIKQHSPSEGIIVQDFDPVNIAKEYERFGASAISVLTDESFFKGSYDILKQIRDSVNLPLLCKDFIIDKKQIRHARLNGADACLLIVRILTDQQLSLLVQEIEYLKMTPVIEVFNEADLKRALKIKAKVIGINNRNLDTLAMDTSRDQSLFQNLPNDSLKLSFSGVKTTSDIQHRLKKFDGVLVGTALLKSNNRQKFLNC